MALVELERLIGFFAPWIMCAAILLLHLVLPARHVVGYVEGPDGEKLRYRLNGMLVFLACVGAWFGLGHLEVLRFDWLYDHRYEGALGAVVMGLVFTFAIVLPAPSTGKSLAADLFLGRHKNPQWFGARVDAKMFLYLFGAAVLGLNLLSFAAHRYLRFGFEPGIALHLGLFFWFLLDYLTFERVHLYTYDIFAERVGFKLGWGCLAFYPYFYAVGLWSVADLEGYSAPVWQLVLAAVVFFSGWSFARGANMQKFYFKTDPEHVFLGFLRPESVTDGNKSLLCSGFWGLSRHVNYLGEILMATGLTLSLGFADVPWPWLYPIYYVLLLVPRQFDDDKRCAEKYGPLWDEYVKRVPRRIIPWVF